MSDGFKPGDRVEYPDYMRAQLGAERYNEQGEVVDVVTGVAERVQLVFSKPDNAFQVLQEGGDVRMDVVFDGQVLTLKRVS